MHIKIPYFQLFSLSHPSLLLLGPRAAGAIKRLRWWSAPCCCRPRPHWDVPAGRKASTLARTRGGMRHGRRRPRTRPRRCFSLGASLSSPRSSRAAARISVKGTGDAVRLSGPNGGRGSWQRKASSAGRESKGCSLPFCRASFALRALGCRAALGRHTWPRCIGRTVVSPPRDPP